MNKKNATSPGDEKLIEDMNSGNLLPEDKALDETYLDPMSYLSEDGSPKKKLKRASFGVNKQIKRLNESIFRFENGGLKSEDGTTVEPLTDEDEIQLEKDLITFFKDTITPLTDEEAQSYGLAEFIYIKRAIGMRQARANGITPQEFIETDKKGRDINLRSEIAFKEKSIEALESGDKDFINDIIRLKETLSQ